MTDNNDWTPDQFYTYEFHDNDETQSVTLLIPTESSWDEEQVNSVAFFDLATYLGVGMEEVETEWYDDDCWLSTPEEMESMGGIYSHLRNKENE